VRDYFDRGIFLVGEKSGNFLRKREVLSWSGGMGRIASWWGLEEFGKLHFGNMHFAELKVAGPGGI